MRLLISGYAVEGKASIAIYEEKAGAIRRVWEDFQGSLSYACPAGALLFAGLERPGGGELLVYHANAGEYRLINRMSVEGGGLCHLFWNAGCNTLYGACYGTGHLFAAAFSGEGKAGPAQLLLELGDGRIHGRDPAISRSHCCMASPDGKHVYAVNISQDRLYCYHPAAGRLDPNPAFTFFPFPEGEGPRHLCFHPFLPVAYVITEYSSRVHALFYEASTGRLAAFQSLSALPDGFSGESFGSGIAVSLDGSRVYAGNRGADTIAVFAAEGDGRLSKIQDAPCGGHWPRHIALSGEGNRLFSANQFSNEVSVLRLDAEGRATGVEFTIPFANPSFVRELA